MVEVDIHPIFSTLMEHEAFFSCLQGGKHSYTQGENVFFLNASKISLSPASREGQLHVMFVRTSMDSDSQDATGLLQTQC